MHIWKLNNIIKLYSAVPLIRLNDVYVMFLSKYFVLDFKKCIMRHRFQKDQFSRVATVTEQLLFQILSAKLFFFFFLSVLSNTMKIVLPPMIFQF